ncbi:hypothetical protein EQW78_10185 [Oerskovia turbata]|uniref:SMP-30/Gluconolactonase/LRE-like region domain-containing protein n=1 Tax=Oerskovia turbata TaxID=1713 RepID=A0A4Q1KUP9_9CELL|nr:hypothetical protein [Oerskovia turbata]RXR25388.1 hypothetical protein EQW73_11130 [Oerskovia turbata]RXR33971.1 hypothetical protein EQW78_10185 [Oerskovia turbata]
MVKNIGMGAWLPRILRAAWVIPGVILLAGCSASEQAAPQPEAVVDLPSSLTDGEVFLLDRYKNKLVVFDAELGVVEEDEREQSFGYAFPTRDSDLMTVGSSLGGDFEIVRRTDTELRSVLTVADRGVFPLATDGADEYFLINDYGPDGAVEDSTVAVLRDAELRELPQITGNVAGGALVDGLLWFTSYDEPSDSFTLSSVLPSDETASPVVVSTGLEDGALFATQGRLIVDGDFGLGPDAPECDLYCYVDEAADRLYALQTTAENLVLVAVDLASGEQRTVVEGDIVDFAPGPDGLVVHLRTGSVTLPEENLP